MEYTTFPRFPPTFPHCTVETCGKAVFPSNPVLRIHKFFSFHGLQNPASLVILNLPAPTRLRACGGRFAQAASRRRAYCNSPRSLLRLHLAGLRLPGSPRCGLVEKRQRRNLLPAPAAGNPHACGGRFAQAASRRRAYCNSPRSLLRLRLAGLRLPGSPRCGLAEKRQRRNLLPAPYAEACMPAAPAPCCRDSDV